MHQENFDIDIKHLSKVEGHTDLRIKVRKGKVEDVKLKIMENKRFYTQAIRGKPFLSIPQIVSRICGTCSVAHMTCCIEAVEKALGIRPSEQTMLLRKLNMYGTMIRDHAMHLYLFCLPDLFGKDSILDFDESQHKLIHQAFAVKAAGNHLSALIGGRAIHSPFEQIGGFSHTPEKEEVTKTIFELKKVRNEIFDLIQLFYECNWKFGEKTNFVALVTKDFSFLEGVVKDTEGETIPESRYWDHVNRVVIPYSQATGFEFEGKEYMVGALARMNLNRQNLHADTRRDTGKFLKVFPSENVFHNNLAQAIEILHCIDHSTELLEMSEFKKEKTPEVKTKAGDGVGVIEAPRGTLYYMMSLNKKGKINYGNLVIPTAQNQIKMEKDIRLLVPQFLKKGKERVRWEIEKLIRAYDPCTTCASHFLKIKWI
jgi:coenzyme F420-reducing hydrogenase alpha subunit